jgi:hypothetical protein
MTTPYQPSSDTVKWGLEHYGKLIKHYGQSSEDSGLDLELWQDQSEGPNHSWCEREGKFVLLAAWDHDLYAGPFKTEDEADQHVRELCTEGHPEDLIIIKA